MSFLKKMIGNPLRLLLLNLVIIPMIASNVWASDATVNSCELPGRDVNLCYKMKNIKNMLNLLEGQTALMDLDYPYLESISNNMGQVVDRILVQMGESSHLASLVEVRKQVAQVSTFARQQDVQVFQSIQGIKTKCQSCHSDQTPTSGIGWEQMGAISWNTINQKCQAEGRNPFICKLMHGVSTQVAFIESIEASQVVNFGATEVAGLEALRLIDILSGLKSSSTPSADLNQFDSIQPLFKRFVSEAQNKNPGVYDLVPSIVQSWAQCHSF